MAKVVCKGRQKLIKVDVLGKKLRRKLKHIKSLSELTKKERKLAYIACKYGKV